MLAPDVIPRTYHSVAVLLPDGRVFSGGGGLCGTCTVEPPRRAHLHSAYLLRPTGRRAPGRFSPAHHRRPQPGSSITVTTDAGVASFALVRTSAVTHGVDNDQRRIPLDADRRRHHLDAEPPGRSRILLPGSYLLFALGGRRHAQRRQVHRSFLRHARRGIPRRSTVRVSACRHRRFPWRYGRGMSTTMTMNQVIHHAVRRDLARLESASGSAPDGDVTRARQLGRAYANLQLELTHHHEGEDEFVFPFLANLMPLPTCSRPWTTSTMRWRPHSRRRAQPWPPTPRAARRRCRDRPRPASSARGPSSTSTSSHEENDLEPLLGPYLQTKRVEANGREEAAAHVPRSPPADSSHGSRTA